MIRAHWWFFFLPAVIACASSPPPAESDLRVDQQGLYQRLAMAEGDSTVAIQESASSAVSLQESESVTELRDEPREFEQSAEAKPQEFEQSAEAKPQVSGLKLPPAEGLENQRDGRQDEFLARERRRMAE